MKTQFNLSSTRILSVCFGGFLYNGIVFISFGIAISIIPIFITCNLATEYKRWHGAINALPFLLKYKKQIDYLISCADHNTESVYLNENGRLCWYWECDSDYGGSSGLMPFCYSKEEAGETWAFSEVKDLLRWMWVYSDYGNREHNDFVFPEHIKSDKDLLKFIQTLNQFNP